MSLGSAWHSAGFQGEQVAVGLLIYDLTGSTGWVGIAYALSFLPMLLIGLPAGVTADRFDRRRLLPRIELSLVVVMACIAVAFMLGAGSVELVLGGTFVAGSFRALSQPVRLSYVHDVMGPERLTGALGFVSLANRCGQLVGALVCGLLLEYHGAASAFSALAIMHLCGAAAFFRLQERAQPKQASGESLRANIAEYLHEMRHNPTLWRLTAIASAVEIFGFSFATALPELATTHLQLGADGLGFIHGARSVGGLLAGLILAQRGRLHRTGYAYIGVIVGFGVALIALSVVPSLLIAMLVAALIAMAAASCDVLVQSMLQLSVADHLRGRAMGAWVLALGAGPIGHLQVGFLGGVIGASATLAVNGGVMIALGALTFFAIKSV
ncbi:MAG: MFS transporter, partial [Chromatiales bacterium]|nr:MFS transporter [Chromatiales bacterium]